MKLTNSLLTFYFFFFSLSLQSQIIGKVIGVKDGDTIVVLDKDNSSYTIRVADIDCPEWGQPFSKRAKWFVSEEIYSLEVIVEKKKIDRYGRIVGLVYYNNKDLSEELLKKGLAWHYVKYSDDENYKELEQEARSKKIGLWSLSNPIEPWIFRRN